MSCLNYILAIPEVLQKHIATSSLFIKPSTVDCYIVNKNNKLHIVTGGKCSPHTFFSHFLYQINLHIMFLDINRTVPLYGYNFYYYYVLLLRFSLWGVPKTINLQYLRGNSYDWTLASAIVVLSSKFLFWGWDMDEVILAKKLFGHLDLTNSKPLRRECCSTIAFVLRTYLVVPSSCVARRIDREHIVI